MRIDDWRSADTSTMSSIYEAEYATWQTTLAWDTRETLAAIDRTRVAGLLPGLIARDDEGLVCGWSYFLRHRDTLQIGGFSAASADVTHLLLDAVLESSTARPCDRWMAFGWFHAFGLADALARRGAAHETYLYLHRPLEPVEPEPAEPAAPAEPAFDSWHTSDMAELPSLLASGYPAAETTRPFAPQGRLDEWIEYSTQLVHTLGCGRFEPELTRVVRSAEGLEGAALVTRLSSRTAHLAQLVVRARSRRCGMGARLTHAAWRAAAADGCDALTLLVRESNVSARALYARLGFVERARFVSAGSPLHVEPSVVGHGFARLEAAQNPQANRPAVA